MAAVALLTPEQLQDLLEQAAERGARRALEQASGGDVLTTSQAARVAGVTRKTVNEWIAAEKLPAGWRGARRTIRREDLDRYLAGQRAAEGASVGELAAGLRRPA